MTYDPNKTHQQRMKQVPTDCGIRWAAGGSQSMSYPASITTTCPSCSVKAVFSTTRRHYDPHRDTMSCSADCPACNAQSHFWITNMVAQQNNPGNDTTCIYMMPRFEDRLDLKHLSGIIPAGVLRQCVSTQEVFATGNRTATSVMVQTALDSIFADFLPSGNSNSTPSQLIRDSMAAINLERPLNNLASSLRPERHLNTLLKNNEHTSQETADALVSLVECLITYLYILPDQFRQLDEKLKALSQAQRQEAAQQGDNQAAA